MMRCKLFSSTVVALAPAYCCFQLLFLQVILCAGINGPDENICSSAFMECAKLGNISYPFWGSASCAASPSYVLSNCTSSSTAAYWDSFSDAVLGVVGPPAITAVEAVYSVDPEFHFYYINAETSIQLSWNRTLIELGYCAPPFSSTNLSLYNIPSSINLTRFPDNSGALEFSSKNTFLLFNCTHNASDVVADENLQAESISGCQPYKGLCSPAAKASCIEWTVPPSMKELMLQHVLDSLACSHFLFGVASPDDNGSIKNWYTGSVELIWTDMECEKCQKVLGHCIHDPTISAKIINQCVCSNGVPLGSDGQITDCSNIILSIDDCSSITCNYAAKVGFGVTAVVVVLGILIVIRFRRQCHNLCGTIYGLIKKSIRVGYLSFTKVTIPIAINVLKSSLKKLQSVSYAPNTSLNTIDFDGLTERPMEYAYNTIVSATKSFSSLVGEGGFGTVYKGTLTQASSHGGSEMQIAVKVLEVRSKHSKKQFLNEVVTIGRIHHVNVVRLLGFCMQEDHEMLVYEYVVNGSLDRWLFVGKGKAPEKVLDWGQRYAIALGIARGLGYLHEECRHRTVHCDIKPQNILLDKEMQPKIADFGLARLMNRDESKVVTFAKGTPGYMAPEFWMGGESQLSTKFDVYSYGMVLLELISGRRNFRHDAAVSGISFPAMAFKAAMEGDLESILDSRLSITSDEDDDQKQAQWHQIKTAAFVALWCIQDQPGRRPNMSEVVKYLEGGAAVSECPPQPNITNFSAQSAPTEPCSSDDLHNDCTPLSGGR